MPRLTALQSVPCELKKEIFLQECWRIEDKKIQGVVFNEMKGNYASFTSVAGDAILDSVSGGTCYAFDSGGDPIVIHELTHEKLKAFHKKHYCTNNCLVFLYGNIPTEEQLDFLDENEFIVRPCNYHASNPGVGSRVVDCGFSASALSMLWAQCIWNALKTPFMPLKGKLKKSEIKPT